MGQISKTRLENARNELIVKRPQQDMQIEITNEGSMGDRSPREDGEDKDKSVVSSMGNV